jgi:hypothetical protein
MVKTYHLACTSYGLQYNKRLGWDSSLIKMYANVLIALSSGEGSSLCALQEPIRAGKVQRNILMGDFRPDIF